MPHKVENFFTSDNKARRKGIAVAVHGRAGFPDGHTAGVLGCTLMYATQPSTALLEYGRIAYTSMLLIHTEV